MKRVAALVFLVAACSGSAPTVNDLGENDLLQADQVSVDLLTPDLLQSDQAQTDSAAPDLISVDFAIPPDLFQCLAPGSSCTGTSNGGCCMTTNDPLASPGSVSGGCSLGMCCVFWIEQGPPACTANHTRTCKDCGTGTACGICN